MKIYSPYMIIVVLFATLSLSVGAQENLDSSDLPPASVHSTLYTREQLDQMLAPIALYPDTLVAQILMAATYPLEVVEAARWLQDPDNAALRGDQLTVALQDKPWDPSIKALVIFPRVVQMMDDNLQWSEQLGDAFIGQQAAFMDEIQRLRHLALAAGTLRSAPPQNVTVQDDIVTIEPADRDVMYVPNYDPMFVYGTWPYPDYPPDYFTTDYVIGGSLIDFGVGIPVVQDFFFFPYCDFRHHRIDIDNQRYRELYGGRPPNRSGIWTYNPAHRHNVPHHAPELQGLDKGQFAVPPTQRLFRGFDRENVTGTLQEQRTAPVNRVAPGQVQLHPPVTTTSRPHVGPTPNPERIRSFHDQAPPPVSLPERRRPVAPVFESYTQSHEVRAQSVRGQGSRSEMAAPRENSGYGRGGVGEERRGGGGSSFGGGRGHR